MPTKDKHIQQYKKNKTLANSKILKQPEYRDWKVTIIYYSALHCIDSSYAEKGIHPLTHVNRREAFERLSGYDEILDDYDNLEMLSRKSRYNCVTISNQEVEDALENLKTIENFIEKLNKKKNSSTKEQ